MTKIDLIKNGDYIELRKQLGITEKFYFNSSKEFFDYIYSYNLMDYLGLDSSFKCIFHKEKNPSASIFSFENEDGNEVYLYNCFSKYCVNQKPLNIIGVVMNLQNNSFSEAMDFVSNSLNMTPPTTQETFDKNNFIKNNLEILENYLAQKPIAKIIGSNLEVLYALYEIALESGRVVDNSIIIGSSKSEIESKLSCKKQVSKVLSVLAYLGIIEKLPLYRVPDEIVQELCRHRQENNQVRNISQIKINDLSKEDIANNAKKFNENGYKASLLTYSMICSKEGPFVAHRIYPTF